MRQQRLLDGGCLDAGRVADQLQHALGRRQVQEDADVAEADVAVHQGHTPAERAQRAGQVDGQGGGADSTLGAEHGDNRGLTRLSLGRDGQWVLRGRRVVRGQGQPRGRDERLHLLIHIVHGLEQGWAVEGIGQIAPCSCRHGLREEVHGGRATIDHDAAGGRERADAFGPGERLLWVGIEPHQEHVRLGRAAVGLEEIGSDILQHFHLEARALLGQREHMLQGLSLPLNKGNLESAPACAPCEGGQVPR